MSTPLILIGAGCGIAPFPGFIEERLAIRNAGPLWLIFGSKRKAHDFLHSERIARWLKIGALQRFDAAFSRDSDDGNRVDRLLLDHGAAIKQWLLDDGGSLYVCGRRAVLESICTALRTVLVAHRGRSEAAAQAEIEAWIAEGKIRADVFN